MKNYMHFVKGIDPVADAFAGTTYTDVWSMRDHGHATIVVYRGVGTTGTSTLTVEACDDFTPTTTSAIPFYYRLVASGDTHGAMTYCASTGYTTTAGSSKLDVIEVDSSALAATGYPNMRLKAVEVANDPVLLGVLIILSEPRYNKAIGRSQIA